MNSRTTRTRPATRHARSGVLACALALLAACDDQPPTGPGATDAARESDGPTAGTIPAPGPYARPQYDRLSQTGFGLDLAGNPADAMAFAPQFALWSDGADKRRWIRLPPGTQVDTSDMDHWIFPIGMKVWKEFALAGRRLETRLVERYGAGPEDFWMGAFVWTEDQTDAVFADAGAPDVLGTGHDVPAARDCWSCHAGEKGRVLGFSALQLSGSDGKGGLLDALAGAGLLSHPPPAGVRYDAPGDPVTRSALGYLHANCGHCHNPDGISWKDAQMVLRLPPDAPTASSTALYQTVVGQPLQHWMERGFSARVLPGRPEASAVWHRLQTRSGMRVQMPPLATELVDGTGVELVRAWIASLESTGVTTISPSRNASEIGDP